MTVEDPALGATSDPDLLRFVPLGGLGQIGMNCFALEFRGRILVVDCGASFPEDDVGEELLVPDFGYLVREQHRICGVFVTHGHEDHIGALPHFLRQLDSEIPIYAPAHAAALIASKMEEQATLLGSIPFDLRVVEPGQVYDLEPFWVEPIRVAHSIIDATALFIETEGGTVLHTADFDLDEQQPAGWLTDETRLIELGNKGVSLLLSDSTNVQTKKRHRSEGDVACVLDDLIAEAQQRVVVALFSSNVHRLVALTHAAQKHERKICLLGRSLRKHFSLAQQLGHLSIKSNALVAPEDAQAMEPRNLLVLSGGSQGESASALRKLSLGTHPHLRLEPSDRVILSSRIIPGNERRVFSLSNDLLRQEVELITASSHPGVHESGHASRAELSKMIEWVRPRAFVPVHGTLMHMKLHRELAQDWAVPHTAVVENGQSLYLTRTAELVPGPRVPSGVVRLLAGGGVLDSRSRRHRYLLARNGVVSIAFVLDRAERIVGLPSICARGVVGVDDDENALNVVLAAVQRTVQTARGRRMSNLDELIVQAVRSVVLEMSRVRPVVLVHVSQQD